MRCLVSLLLCLSCHCAHAHKASDSYLRLRVESHSIQGHWDIALRDLDTVLQLDANGDGQLTWAEVAARRADIAAYALSRLEVQGCIFASGDLMVDAHSDGMYAVLPLHADCATGGAITIRYRLFAENDAQHRGLLQLESAGQIGTAVLGPDQPPRTFTLHGDAPGWNGYLRMGVEHIWHGYDHLLFLFVLLLPAVLPHARLRHALWDVAKVVTAFTAAHSATLAAATLGLIHLPSRWVEASIAASIVMAALNNLRQRQSLPAVPIAFGFGLIHGLGFASALTALQLPPDALAGALLGFNLGVELGQLSIVGPLLPIAWLVRMTGAYRRLMQAGSGGAALLGLIWCVQRALDLPNGA